MVVQVQSAPRAKTTLPPPIVAWFAARGWEPRRHQWQMIEAAQAGQHALLVAPTGAGKTLAGFLPSLIDLADQPDAQLHTLYISPLKALAEDIARNLTGPVQEMGLPIRIETRTGDTSSAIKSKQRHSPPHILLTTPESLSLLLTYPDSARLFGSLKRVVIDEVHAFAPTKRGDLLSLALARLHQLAPHALRAGLSATIADEAAYLSWITPHNGNGSPPARLVHGDSGAQAQITILLPDGRIPWSGHAARHSVAAVYELIKANRLTLVFVNTRGIAERIFQDLWAINADNLPIGLHHGSLDLEQRQRVESAMATGQLKAIVATSSLDLGLDWGAVDLVVQMGAPKGSARLLQRIGRANHRLDEPSRAVLVPGNRFEYLEAQAAIDAIADATLDSDGFGTGSLDVLAQHLMGMACAAPFSADAMFTEVTTAAPYADLQRKTFDDVLGFIVNGGYALGAYDRFKRLRLDADGFYHITHPRLVLQHRLNAGTIVEAPTLTVRLGFRPLGKIEEWFAGQLSPGDSFLFAGQMLEFVKLENADVKVKPSRARTPKVPAYVGGRLPLTTHLADRVRHFLAEPDVWSRFPDDVREWLEMQQKYSVLPKADGLLIETFPRDDRHYMVAYCFEGRNAHQSLGLLLTRRMESAGLAPMGFVGTDYVLSIWSLKPVLSPEKLFVPDILENEFEAWMADSSLLKRSFRDVAVISGLIERQHPGKRKTGKQVAFSTDLIYDVLRKYDPAHVLLRATWADARGKVTDIERLTLFLQRIQGHIDHKPLQRVSPLAVPVMLEIGKEHISGAGDEMLLMEADALVRDAMGAA